MKLAYVTHAYPAYLADLEARAPELAAKPWEQQRDAWEADAYGWLGVWRRALAPLGWQVLDVVANAEPMLRAWAREHQPGLAGAERAEIVVTQLRGFAPDVIWYDLLDDALLARIRDRVPSVRAVVGWVGTMVPRTELWRRMEVVLSCDADAVDTLRASGARAELLPHAFDPAVLPRLERRPPRHEVTFVGQIASDHPLHVHRERLLESLVGRVPLEVFTPSAPAGAAASVLLPLRLAAWESARAMRRAGMSEGALGRVPVVGRAASWPARPRLGMSARLARVARPGTFGLAMFQTLLDSKLTLNVHASSMTRGSSNMRLFEATGVGACLITDAAERLGELFEPERELVTFRSADECAERIGWLLAHAEEREAIARAGQARTLRDHTFERRAPLLDGLLRGVVR